MIFFKVQPHIFWQILMLINWKHIASLCLHWSSSAAKCMFHIDLFTHFHNRNDPVTAVYFMRNASWSVLFHILMEVQKYCYFNKLFLPEYKNTVLFTSLRQRLSAQLAVGLREARQLHGPRILVFKCVYITVRTVWKWSNECV